MKSNAIIALLLVLIFSLIGIKEQVFSQNQNLTKSVNLVNLLMLTAAGNGYSDQTIVVFIPESTPGFDPQYDAYKLPGSPEAPQLYSIIPGTNLAINALPEILINYVVQLGFKVGLTNNYSITATETNSFDPSVSIFLDDTKDGVLVDLKTNPVYNFTAAPGDNIQRFKLYFRYPVHLDLKVFLEGSFIGIEMENELNTGNFLPLNQPYNNPPWNYEGTESVLAIPNTDIVDWLLVEIRDTLDAPFAGSATSVEKAAGFLLKNGSIVGMDGISPLIFKETISDSIFMVVWHRNHLGLISSAGPEELGGIFSYNFTTGSDKAFGGSSALKEIGLGIFGMIAGDFNADGIINDLDKSDKWTSQAGKEGYLMGDGSLEGQINNQDKNDYWFINQNAESQVPE
jgi:hypothetical protein